VKHIHSNQLAGRSLYHTGLLAKKTTIRNSYCLFIFTIICNRKDIKRPYFKPWDRHIIFVLYRIYSLIVSNSLYQ